MITIIPQRSGMSPVLVLDFPQLSIMCDEALQKIIAVLMSHLQPCCETLTLRHTWLSLRDKRMTAGRINQVHCACLQERRERERERAEGEEKGGNGDRPGQREERRHVLAWTPACTGTGSPALSCRTRGRRTRKGTQPGHQKEGGEGEEEGGRERAKTHRSPEKRPQRKNLRRSLPKT